MISFRAAFFCSKAAGGVTVSFHCEHSVSSYPNPSHFDLKSKQAASMKWEGIWQGGGCTPSRLGFPST